MSSLLRSLFPRSSQPSRSSRSRRSRRGWTTMHPAVRSSRRRREAFLKRRRTTRGVRPGVESLESRAMLAADDIVVSLVGNQLVLTLDPAGTAITNLSTSYAAQAGVLRVTAQSAGTLSAAAAIPGVTIDPASDTISVNLKTVTKFAGISVVGDSGTDVVTIGPGGVNLAAVTRGAAAQSLSIDTGTGLSDAIVIASPVSAKAAGDVNLLTEGQATKHGILLSANVTSPAGSQTFAGAVTLEGDVTVKAGKVITVVSTVDGDQRLTVFEAQ